MYDEELFVVGPGLLQRIPVLNEAVKHKDIIEL